MFADWIRDGEQSQAKACSPFIDGKRHRLSGLQSRDASKPNVTSKRGERWDIWKALLI